MIKKRKQADWLWYKAHKCDECKWGEYDENPLNRSIAGGYTLIKCGKYPLARP